MKKYTLKIEVEIESDLPKYIINMTCLLLLKDRISSFEISEHISWDSDSVYIPVIDEHENT